MEYVASFFPFIFWIWSKKSKYCKDSELLHWQKCFVKKISYSEYIFSQILDNALNSNIISVLLILLLL